MDENKYLLQANEKWNKFYANLPTRSKQKVQFNDKPVIHHIFAWSFAYQAARKGPWEQYARDSDRFKQRIKQTEKKIGHIFPRNHVTLPTNQISHRSHDTS